MGLDFKAPCKFTLSANEIRQFCECPRRRYYSSRDCLAIRAATNKGTLLLGSAFHKALMYYYTELNNAAETILLGDISYEDAVMRLQEAMDSMPEYELPTVTDVTTGEVVPMLSAGDLATYNNIIRLYREQIPYDVAQFEIVNCEETFYLHNWPIPDVMYHGFIDMIVKDRSDGLVYFFEHKTCANFRPEIYSRFDIQLHLYAVYGVQTYGDKFGGMILNQVKKAKTARGYDMLRSHYAYSEAEMEDFTNWLTAKTAALASPENIHAPCNNYMSCKTCEYQNICMKYGYEVPKTHEEIIASPDFEEEGKPMFTYDPRNLDETLEEG
jgi:hypothetical protein